jgi:DNA polymerase III gamma/tau subunit
MGTITLYGHGPQREELERDIQTGNIAHAYLFEGPASIGKCSVATWFATELLTQGLSDEEKTKQTRAIEKLVHPDLLVLDKLWMHESFDDLDQLAKYSNVPQAHRIKSKAKTDTISIDDVRAIQERLYETGTGRYRCCIIRSVERMQDEAVNALLKPLEEPPEGVVFLLTTQAQTSLLPTLVSRARVLKFHRLSRKELLPLLTDISADEAAFLIMIAQGAPGTIIRLRDNPEALREARLLHTQAVAFWHTKRLADRLSILSPIEKRGAQADAFVRHLSLSLHEDVLGMKLRNIEHLQALLHGLETNASRPLLLQRFAMAVTGEE